MRASRERRAASSPSVGGGGLADVGGDRQVPAGRGADVVDSHAGVDEA